MSERVRAGHEGPPGARGCATPQASEALLGRLAAAGCAARRDVDLPGLARAFVDDPFGNRIELVAA